MTLKLDELKNIIEAALLTSDAPLSQSEIQSLFLAEVKPERKDIDQALEALQQDCAARPLELRKIGKGYRYYTRDIYAPWLRKLRESRPPRYSRALLETLAIIAYRQPVSRGDIEDIRGVTVSTDIMRVLLDREWIKQVGYRDVPGRPALFGTTAQFLEYFSLESLKELPELMDQRDVGEIARELNLELPIEPVENIASVAQDDDEADQGEFDQNEEDDIDFSSGELPTSGEKESDKEASVISLNPSRNRQHEGEQSDEQAEASFHQGDEQDLDNGLEQRKAAEGSGA